MKQQTAKFLFNILIVAPACGTFALLMGTVFYSAVTSLYRDFGWWGPASIIIFICWLALATYLNEKRK